MGCCCFKGDLHRLRTNDPLLVTLNLRHQRYSDDQMDDLCELLLLNSHVKKLWLGANRIGPRGASSLSKVLAHDPALTHLDLSANMIGDPGSFELARSLEKNSTLKSLGLSHNGIGDPGAVALAACIRGNSCLEVLGLGSNDIRDSGAEALLTLLRDITRDGTQGRLKRVDLSNNPLAPNMLLDVSFPETPVSHDSPTATEVPIEERTKQPLDSAEGNFVVFTRLVLKLLPELLRDYFVQCWDTKYPEHTWCSTGGDILIDGMLPCSVPLPGTVSLKQGSGRVDTSWDTGGVLEVGDKVQIAKELFIVVAVKQRSFTLNKIWEAESCQDTEIWGQALKCEKNLKDEHCRGKILSGDLAQWDITILTFVLVSSSHQLMGDRQGELAVVRALRTVRNTKFGHASDFGMSKDDLEDVCTLIIQFVALCLPSKLNWCRQQLEEAKQLRGTTTDSQDLAVKMAELQATIERVVNLSPTTSRTNQINY
jgi:hypothetical protein